MHYNLEKKIFLKILASPIKILRYTLLVFSFVDKSQNSKKHCAQIWLIKHHSKQKLRIAIGFNYSYYRNIIYKSLQIIS